jgi:hypothetical protein
MTLISYAWCMAKFILSELSSLSVTHACRQLSLHSLSWQMSIYQLTCQVSCVRCKSRTFKFWSHGPACMMKIALTHWVALQPSVHPSLSNIRQFYLVIRGACLHVLNRLLTRLSAQYCNLLLYYRQVTITYRCYVVELQ